MYAVVKLLSFKELEFYFIKKVLYFINNNVDRVPINPKMRFCSFDSNKNRE